MKTNQRLAIEIFKNKNFQLTQNLNTADRNVLIETIHNTREMMYDLKQQQDGIVQMIQQLTANQQQLQLDQQPQN